MNTTDLTRAISDLKKVTSEAAMARYQTRVLDNEFNTLMTDAETLFDIDVSEEL